MPSLAARLDDDLVPGLDPLVLGVELLERWSGLLRIGVLVAQISLAVGAFSLNDFQEFRKLLPVLLPRS